MQKNMQQNMHKICHKICKEYAKYAKKYAKYVISKNISSLYKICKICNEYAKYVSQNLICRICTPHFADGARFQMSGCRVRVRGTVTHVSLAAAMIRVPTRAGPRAP